MGIRFKKQTNRDTITCFMRIFASHFIFATPFWFSFRFHSRSTCGRMGE
jgi:hypothetical protein